MGRVILVCGKICSGKSHYAKHLSKTENAVILSCDEIAFDLLLNKIEDSDLHDETMARVSSYLYKKSVQIVRCGTNVILDYSPWDKKGREIISEYYNERDILVEWHYIDISDQDWKANIEQRNRSVLEGNEKAYYLDEGLMAKMLARFEQPQREEIDVWFMNTREER